MGKAEQRGENDGDRGAERYREKKLLRTDQRVGTRPLPENFLSSACARKIDAIEPANVVIVAQVIAVR